uniref:Uncharacterized protein n=1 Tax=Triticum urartu TaxID=4572 RepID=A0A8R7U6B6_TRIUA
MRRHGTMEKRRPFFLTFFFVYFPCGVHACICCLLFGCFIGRGDSLLMCNCV